MIFINYFVTADYEIEISQHGVALTITDIPGFILMKISYPINTNGIQIIFQFNKL